MIFDISFDDKEWLDILVRCLSVCFTSHDGSRAKLTSKFDDIFNKKIRELCNLNCFLTSSSNWFVNIFTT